MRTLLAWGWLLAVAVSLLPGSPPRPQEGKPQPSVAEAEKALDWQLWGEARRLYLDLLNRDPEKSGLHEALGYICLREGKGGEAIAHLEAELKLDPANNLSRMLLGIVLLAEGRAPESLTTLLIVARQESLSYYPYLDQDIEKNPALAGSDPGISYIRKNPYFKKFLLDNAGLIPFCLGVAAKACGRWQTAEYELYQAGEREVKKEYRIRFGPSPAEQLRLNYKAWRDGYSRREIMVQLLDLYLQQGKEAEAEAALQLLAAEDEELSEALLPIGKSRDKVQEYARSRPIKVKYFKTAIPELVADLSQSAQNAVREGAIESALRCWERALYVDDASFTLHYNMALIQYLHGMFRECLHHCRCAISTGDHEHLQWAYNLAGNACYDLEQFDRAVGYYRQALAIDPRYLKCRNNLAEAFFRLSQWDEAEKEWLDVIASAKKGEKKGGFSENEAGEVIRVDMDVMEADVFTEACRGVAELYRQQGRDDKASVYLIAYLQVKPDDANVHFEVGKILHAQRDAAGARRHLLKALEISSDHAKEIRQLLGSLGEGEKKKQ